MKKVSVHFLCDFVGWNLSIGAQEGPNPCGDGVRNFVVFADGFGPGGGACQIYCSPVGRVAVHNPDMRGSISNSPVFVRICGCRQPPIQRGPVRNFPRKPSQYSIDCQNLQNSPKCKK